MSSSGGATGQLPPTAVIGAGANVPLATKAGTKIVNVPPFQAATAYPEGFCVLHEGGVYKRITAGTSGASWAADESHWELQLPASAVTTSGAQTIAGVKTFTSSPVVPVPTTAEQAARKATVEAETARAEAAEATKAPLASPALTGTPTAPTPTANANTTQIATAAAVHTAKGEAQSEAETLAAAAQSGAEGAATTALALKAPLASPALTGTPTAPTPTESDSSTKLATTAFAHEVATTAKSAAETASIPLTQKGAASGVAQLDSESHLLTAELPPSVVSGPIIVTANEELTVPAWAHHALIVGVSGGAGGGGGGSAKTAGGVAKQVGGSGGGSAMPAEGLFAVTPGAKLILVVGKGTAGGAGGEANEHAGTAGEASIEATVSCTSGAAVLICSTPLSGPGGAANSEVGAGAAPSIWNGNSALPGSSGGGHQTNGTYGVRGVSFQAPGADSGFPANATEGGKGGQNKGATSVSSAYANQNPGNSYTGTTAGGEGVSGTLPGEGGGGGGGGAPGGAGGKGGKGANGQFWVTFQV